MSDNSKALALVPHTAERPTAIIPRTSHDVRELATVLAKSRLLPEAFRGNEADIVMAIMSGAELRLAPMASLRGIAVIKGRPSLSAATMQAVILGSGLAEYFECVDDKVTSVTYETKRVNGRTPQRATWTIEEAKRAGLGGDNWTKYPNDMLHARCISRLGRRVYPDVLAGYYTEEETDSFIDDDRKRVSPRQQRRDIDVVDAEVVSETRTVPRSEAAAWAGEVANSIPDEPMPPPKTPHQSPSEIRDADARDDKRTKASALDEVANVLISDINKAETVDAVKNLQPRFAALPKQTTQRDRAYRAYLDRIDALTKPPGEITVERDAAAGAT